MERVKRIKVDSRRGVHRWKGCVLSSRKALELIG